jgi:hypothetical protein
MSCSPGLDFNPLDCPGAVVDGIASATGNALADAMRSGSSWVLKETTGWWLQVPAIDISASPAAAIRSLTLPLAIIIATAGIIWQGIVMVSSRKKDPLLNVGRGLMTVAVWSAVGITGITIALKASDSFAVAALDSGAQGQAAERLAQIGGLAGVTAPGAIIVLGLVMMLAGLAQALLMMLREGSLVVLAGLVVIAAAGSFSGATRPWLQKWIARCLALIVYKPIVAVIYFASFRMLGDGIDPRVAVVGLGMLLLSIVALPALVKFFDWAVPSATGAGGGGLLSAAAGVGSAAMYAKAMGGSGSGHDPVAFAAEMDRSGPGTGGSRGGGSGGPSGAAPSAGPSSGSWPAPSAATGGSSAGAGASGAAAGGGAMAAAGPVGIGLAVAQGAKTAADKAAGTLGGDGG